MKLSKILKGIRAKNNLSQDQLGKLLGVHRVTLQNWEYENTKPKETNLIKIDYLYKNGIKKYKDYFNVKD